MVPSSVVEDAHRPKERLRTDLGVEGWEAAVNDGRLACDIERGSENGRP